MSEKLNLTNSDLNDFRIVLNGWNDKLLLSSREMIKARTLCSAGKITRSEYQSYISKYNSLKAEYNKLADTSKFKQYYIQCKRDKKLANKSKIEYTQAKYKFNESKRFYKLATESVKNRGIDGELIKISNIALRVNNLSFRYDISLPIVVDGVSFDVEHGEYVAIIGHNGSGKSTLSKILIGVLEPINGEIYYYGNLSGVGNINLIRKFMGIVFQNPDNQFIGSTVRDDVAFGLENRRVNPIEMTSRIKNAVTKVGMEKFLDSEPLTLSGGQKQRVAIASALALSSDILIFDEATSMLDPKGKSEVKKIMVELKETRNHTILSITHDMDEILNADKVLVMNQGKLVRFGTPDEVLKDKKFLRSIHLDIPFVSQIEEALATVGIKAKGSKNIDELVDKICQK
ncbi:energy-coupling factor transporter ATPase [Spiroplasma endosymbiont of Aspidapion aeneum]|uniref:energy-coupling factor transporter ATPase n=1 Tax=Spiroplasma endosymbiont of Aspidapion aeneum TaxID=3066276 RepID=UPI00313CE6B4